MSFATANPNEYLVVGRGGTVVNRGTGIRVFLWPGSTFVLVPSTKQEATFEMTQETKDGIPLRFKGVVIYRIVQPEMSASNFNFKGGGGVKEINMLINNICLGELRAVVSGMTMQECIEQRKTVLTSAVDEGLRQIIRAGKEGISSNWGIELEMVQVAQVFIVDAELRRQLEAEIRNDIRAKSDQSDIHMQEETRLTQLASERRVLSQKLVSEKDAIRHKEEIDLANLQSRRHLQAEDQELAREAIALATEKFKLEQEAEKEKAEIEKPIQLLKIEQQREVLERELENRRIEKQVRDLEVERDMTLEKARQELRKEILPLEQTPEVAEALAGVLHGANLTVYGNENQIMATIVPLVDMLSKIVKNNLTREGNA